MFQNPIATKYEDAIIVENVSKHFRIPHEKKNTIFEHIVGMIGGKSSRYEDFCALKNVSFRVKKGETLGIIGENGSGKSTILKIIAGVLSPDSGRVKVNGKIAPFLELGVGFQPDLTAEDNVRLYGAIMGMTKKEMESKFEGIFEFAELDRFRNMKLKNFSSGMYARLAFATAIATDPDVLLIDEVLAVGDEGFQSKCFEKIFEFQKKGKTILFVSHDLKLCELLCSRSILITNSKINVLDITSKVTDKYRRLMLNKIKIKDNRWGNHEIVIRNVTLMRDGSTISDSFIINETMIINIEYLCNSHIEKFIVGFAFFSASGILIGNGSTEKSSKWNCSDDYTGKVSCIIESLPLLEGNYYLSVGITDPTTINTYDHHDKMYKFTVISQDETKELGLVHINCKWVF